MKFGLRSRAVFTLLAVVIPITIGFSYYRWHVELRTMIERHAERTTAHIQANPERICLPQKPEDLVRRGFPVHTYALDLTPNTPDAPALPASLRNRLQQSPEAALQIDDVKDTRYAGATAALIPHTESNPHIPQSCAIALLAWPDRQPPGAPSLKARALFQGLALMISLIAVGLLISAPLVFRLRRLSDAVRNATAGQFDNPEAHRSPTHHDELTELAYAFDTTIAAFHNRDTALKEYIANTTHDLAIPLTVLQHKLTALRPHIPQDDTQAFDHIEVAIEESHYIASLIANMSAAAKLEAEHINHHLAPVHLDEIVARVAARHQPIADQKNIALNFSTPDSPVITTGDATLVEQAFSNLVQNAVQYNNPGGHVSIILEHEANDHFQLRVIDDGPGIPPELTRNLIQRGIRTDDARNRNTSGQGFGLAIAQQVCTRHGWTLTLQPHDSPDGTTGTEAIIHSH